MAFLRLAKVVHGAFEDKCQFCTLFSEVKLWYVDLYVLHDLHNTSASRFCGDKITDMMEKEFQNQ